MRRLRRDLNAIGVGLACDDFGAGQSRLKEIAEAPPDYLKFDMGLVRNLNRGSGRRREPLEGLVATANSLGITPVAEGVETAEEEAACRAVGFPLAQGFFFGCPLPIDSGRSTRAPAPGAGGLPASLAGKRSGRLRSS